MQETLEQLLAQVERYKVINEQCCMGDYPPEAFTWTCKIRDLSGLDKGELAAETSRYIKEHTGKIPGFTPAPRFDVPFSYASKLAGCTIQAVLKSSFVCDMQVWLAENQPKIMRMQRQRTQRPLN